MSEHVAIESTIFCFKIGNSLICFVRFVTKFYRKAQTNTTSTEISDQKCPEPPKLVTKMPIPVARSLQRVTKKAEIDF